MSVNQGAGVTSRLYRTGSHFAPNAALLLPKLKQRGYRRLVIPHDLGLAVFAASVHPEGILRVRQNVEQRGIGAVDVLVSPGNSARPGASTRVPPRCFIPSPSRRTRLFRRPEGAVKIGDIFETALVADRRH